MKLLLRHHICTPSRAFSGFGTSTYRQVRLRPRSPARARPDTHLRRLATNLHEYSGLGRCRAPRHEAEGHQRDDARHGQEHRQDLDEAQEEVVDGPVHDVDGTVRQPIGGGI